MRDGPSPLRAVVMSLVLTCLLLPISTGAELATDERLAEEGLTLLALRNDTIDSNQDGDIDAVRVVVVLNSTAASNDLIVKLRGLHKEREVLVTQEVSFQGQTNITLVYDAWSKGEHVLRLDFFDENGDFIASNPLPTFMLTPALQVPRVALQLNAGDGLQTGETCEIIRDFADETGPRYGQSGVRTFTGAPFSVLDTHDVLDCSSWPAGAYELKETYRNGLGQTAENMLNFTIKNRPAPEFSLKVTGHENATDTPCMVSMILNDGRSESGLTTSWSIKGKTVEGANTSMLDCSNLPAGAYLITLEVVTEKMISSTEGVNLIRLPAADLSANETASLPSSSLGMDTPTESVGWLSISALALVVSIIVFVSMVRSKEPEALDLPSIGPTPQLLPDGSPDTGGLPTTLDDQGVLWRQHPSGEVDWWDQEWSVWHRWE
ncbi:MAG: hypothetical protein ACPGKR_03245 [Poseidonia sp.]